MNGLYNSRIPRGKFKGFKDMRRFKCYNVACRKNGISCSFCSALPYFESPLRECYTYGSPTFEGFENLSDATSLDSDTESNDTIIFSTAASKRKGSTITLSLMNPMSLSEIKPIEIDQKFAIQVPLNQESLEEPIKSGSKMKYLHLQIPWSFSKISDKLKHRN